MRLIWSPMAVEDIEELRDHIAAESPQQAAVVVRRLVAAAESLTDLPGRGRVVPEVGDDAIRELIIRPFRLVYRVSETAVGIVTVLRSTRLFPRDIR